MGGIRAWWRTFRGKAPEKPAPVVRHAKAEQSGPGELELTEPPPSKKPANIGAGGFDPYSSDAGYTKPHSWERVDHD